MAWDAGVRRRGSSGFYRRWPLFQIHGGLVRPRSIRSFIFISTSDFTQADAQGLQERRGAGGSPEVVQRVGWGWCSRCVVRLDLKNM
jgi:hypothetical protein